MQDRLQTQLFGPYFGSFSAHNYGYELSNDPKSVLKLLDFRFGPIVGQTPRKTCVGRGVLFRKDPGALWRL